MRLSLPVRTFDVMRQNKEESTKTAISLYSTMVGAMRQYDERLLRITLGKDLDREPSKRTESGRLRWM